MSPAGRGRAVTEKKKFNSICAMLCCPPKPHHLVSKRISTVVCYPCSLVFAFLKYEPLISYDETMKLIVFVYRIHMSQGSCNANIELNCLFLEPL